MITVQINLRYRISKAILLCSWFWYYTNENRFLIFYYIYFWSTRAATPVTYSIHFVVFNFLSTNFVTASICIGICFVEKNIDSPPIFNLGSCALSGVKWLVGIKRSLHLVFYLWNHSKKRMIFGSALYFFLESSWLHLLCFD